MDWSKVDDILAFGTKEDIDALTCPDCGGQLEYELDIDTLKCKCKACGAMCGNTGATEFSCIKIYGSKHTI